VNFNKTMTAIPLYVRIYIFCFYYSKDRHYDVCELKLMKHYQQQSFSVEKEIKIINLGAEAPIHYAVLFNN